uniref:Uncharacterized protein n=1 Tax=Romanomermis culicivorax TaxID=13658 RepID=A0A915L5M3_ROMCU
MDAVLSESTFWLHLPPYMDWCTIINVMEPGYLGGDRATYWGRRVSDCPKFQEGPRRRAIDFRTKK